MVAGYRVWGLGLEVQGLGFRVQCSGFGVQDLACRRKTATVGTASRVYNSFCTGTSKRTLPHESALLVDMRLNTSRP